MDIPNLNPIVGAVEAGANAVEKVAGVFTSNAEMDAQRSSEEQMALLRSYQSEFAARQNRTWIDAFADAFNRLVRPFIVVMVLSIFIVAYVSPTQFALIGTAMGAIPNGYWALLSVVIGFYFGGRMQLKRQDFEFQKSQVSAVKQLIEAKGAFRKLEMDRDEPDKLVGDAIAKHEMVKHDRTAKRNQVIEAFLKTPPEQRAAALPQTTQKMLEQEAGEGIDLANMGKYRGAA
jgi:uncharacterized integral membrane protein